ncbi:hypothetical protein Dimus_037440, partial [Dionaea muscipula]
HCNQTRRLPIGAAADLPRSASPSSPPPEGLSTCSPCSPVVASVAVNDPAAQGTRAGRKREDRV